MSKIKPLNARVLLQRIEASDKTAGGILLPDSAKEKPTEGKVIAVGEGKARDNGQRVPLAVKVGDRVLFSSYAGTQIKEGGTEYLILEASEILAVVDDAPFAKAAGGKKADAGKASAGKSASAKKAKGKKK